jgi:hypothetical protein
MATSPGHVASEDELRAKEIEASVRELCQRVPHRDGMEDRHKRMEAPWSIENLVRLWMEYDDLSGEAATLLEICQEELAKIPDEKRCPMVRMYVQAKEHQLLGYSEHNHPLEEGELELHDLFPDEDKSAKRLKIGKAVEALDKARGKVDGDTYCALANGVFTSRRMLE